MKVRNRSPFAVSTSVVLDRRGAENVVVVVKGTFSVHPDLGTVTEAEEQAPIRTHDVFHGDPAASSIAGECEIGPLKPATDVFLRGHALASYSGMTSTTVSFRVGPVAQEATVFGPRRWRAAMGVPTAGTPEPFEAVPLHWERAFGGADTSAPDPSSHGWESRNPVGVGFRTKDSRLPVDGAPLPQIEDPRAPITRPDMPARPIGFGPTGRHWEPRVRYAGTYDAAWQSTRMPLLPKDFDERFLNSAPDSLICPGYLLGGEVVEVLGCTPAGRLAFSLPAVTPVARVDLRTRSVEPTLHLETVTVDADASRVEMLWKGQFEAHGEIAHLERLTVDLPAEGAA